MTVVTPAISRRTVKELILSLTFKDGNHKILEYLERFDAKRAIL
jgi:hypothetical protein